MKRKIITAILFLNFFKTSVSQNVGIGTANPWRAKLELHGAVGATSAIFGGDSTGVSLQQNWPGIGFNQYYNGGSKYISQGFAAVQFLNPNNGHMSIDMFHFGSPIISASVSARALTLTNDGRMAIGTNADPTASLFVARGYGNGTASFLGTTNHSHFNVGTNEDTYIRAGKNNGTVFINDIPNGKVVLNGFVGINTASPVSSLEIRQKNSTGLSLVDPATFHYWELRVGANLGWLHLFRNGALAGRFFEDGRYGETSDRRLKTDIQPLLPLLDKVMKLEPVEYKLKNANTLHTTIGFIAQDVVKLFPGLVRVTTDTTNNASGLTDLHTLSYTDFGVVAIKAIQEQQAIIEKQEQRIAALEERLGMPLQKPKYSETQ